LEDFFRADKIKIKKILPLGRQLSRGFVLLLITGVYYYATFNLKSIFFYATFFF